MPSRVTRLRTDLRRELDVRIARCLACSAYYDTDFAVGNVVETCAVWKCLGLAVVARLHELAPSTSSGPSGFGGRWPYQFCAQPRSPDLVRGTGQVFTSEPPRQCQVVPLAVLTLLASEP